MKGFRARPQKSGKVWSASLIVNSRGMPMTKQTLRTAFADAKAAAMVKHPSMADAIGNFWFVDLRKKASSDVQITRGIKDAADLLGHGDVRTTQANYSPLGKTARPTK